MPDYRVVSYNGCIVNGVRYHTETHDQQRSTQNYGIWVEGEHNGKACDFYGVITDIFELTYVFDHKIVIFKWEWYETEERKKRVRTENHITSINIGSKWYRNEPFILANQAKQVYYLRDDKFGSNWKVVEKVYHRHLWDVPEVPSEPIDECDDFSNEAYQEERSNDVNVTFGDTSIESTLTRTDT